MSKVQKDNEQNELVIVARVETEVEATPIVAAIKEAGIAVTMTGSFTAGFVAEAPGDIQIKVFEVDVAVATKIIEKFEIENDKIDWDKVDVGDPID